MHMIHSGLNWKSRVCENLVFSCCKVDNSTPLVPTRFGNLVFFTISSQSTPLVVTPETPNRVVKVSRWIFSLKQNADKWPSPTTG